MLKIEICLYSQTEESAIASCKRLAADAPPELQSCARLQRQTVAAPWERPGDRIARSVHPETPTIITNSVWTRDSPWTGKVRSNVIYLIISTMSTIQSAMIKARIHLVFALKINVNFQISTSAKPYLISVGMAFASTHSAPTGASAIKATRPISRAFDVSVSFFSKFKLNK